METMWIFNKDNSMNFYDLLKGKGRVIDHSE